MTRKNEKQSYKNQATDLAAYRPLTGPTSWNWWYHDADFDNGYVLAASLHFGVPRPPGGADRRFIEFTIFDPEGKRYFVRPGFSVDQCSASEERLDVVMGNNYYRAEGNGVHFYFSEKELGCDLVHEPVIPGFLPDQSWIPGMGPERCYYIVSPKARVSGNITVQGKTIEVAGYGYQEHVSDTVPMGAVGLPPVENSLWGRIYKDDWSILWQNGAMFAGRGDKLALESIGTATEHLFDLTTKDTGLERPERFVFRVNDPGRAEGEIRFKVMGVLVFMDLMKRFKPFKKWFMSTYFGEAGYLRYLVEYEMDLTILGEEVTGTGQAWCEHHKMPA